MGDQGVTLKQKPASTLTQEEISRMNSEEINRRLEQLGVKYTKQPKSIFEKQETQNIVKMTAELTKRLSSGESVEKDVEKASMLLMMQVPVARDLAEDLRRALKRLTGEEYQVNIEGGRLSVKIKKGEMFQPVFTVSTKEVSAGATFHLGENLDISAGGSFGQKSPTAKFDIAYRIGGSAKNVPKQIKMEVPAELYRHISPQLIDGQITKDNMRSISRAVEAAQAKGLLAQASIDGFKDIRDTFVGSLSISLIPEEPVGTLPKSMEKEVSQYLTQGGIKRDEKDRLEALTNTLTAAGVKPRRINKFLEKLEEYGTARFEFSTEVASNFFDVVIRPFELAKGPRTR